MCDCKKKGIGHWWRYLRFRLWWRRFWARMRYEHRIIDGEDRWVEACWPETRVYNQYPGPSMSRDEHEHWFPSKGG